FQINLSDAREPSVTNRLVSSVIPTNLWAEGITCDAIHDFGRYPISPTELQELPWIQIIETLDSILDAEPLCRYLHSCDSLENLFCCWSRSMGVCVARRTGGIRTVAQV
ncbi:hypothetical protein FRC02_005517, partial [Tulasnella sp. 418]